MKKILSLLTLFLSFSIVSGVERDFFYMGPLDKSKKSAIVPEPPQVFRFNISKSISVGDWKYDPTTKIWWAFKNTQ